MTSQLERQLAASVAWAEERNRQMAEVKYFVPTVTDSDLRRVHFALSYLVQEKKK